MLSCVAGAGLISELTFLSAQINQSGTFECGVIAAQPDYQSAYVIVVGEK